MNNVPAIKLETLDKSLKFISLAESLSIAEKECNKFRKNNSISSNLNIDINQLNKDDRLRNNQKNRRNMQQYRNKNSIFLRPESFPRRINIRNIPDHHKNPHKWTKYSLADISNEKMSDKSNTEAAFSFLNSLKSRKKEKINNYIDTQQDESMEISESTELQVNQSKKKLISKIQFRKPNNEAAREEISSFDDDKPQFKNSTIVMPEYVIGQKKQMKKSYKKQNISEQRIRLGHVTLDHLQESIEEKEES